MSEHEVAPVAELGHGLSEAPSATRHDERGAGDVRLTWWGHATALIEDSGVRILTDPVLTQTLAHLRRRRGPVPGRRAAAAVDVVLVSHLHADHLHVRSLRNLPAGTPVVLPWRASRLLEGTALVPLEVVPGDEVEVGPVRVRVVRAAHDGRRGPGSRLHAPAMGFVVYGAARTYFAGDTAAFASLASEVGPVDLALLPVGGWGPTLGQGHMNAAAAAQVAYDLAPRVAVPVHYGTLWPVGMETIRRPLFDQPGRDFARFVAASAPSVDVRVLDPGESTIMRARSITA